MSFPGRVVDFHMHTTHSDGTLSPAELMRECRRQNLACVSVTDHDTISGFQPCLSEAQKQGVELIPGVEISADFEPGTLHILGYFFDPQHSRLQKELEGLQEVRRERTFWMIQKLNELGIDLSFEEAAREALAEEGQDLNSAVIGRPHIARVLIRKKAVKTEREAFEKYLGKGCPAYLDKQKLSPEETIVLINEAGGVASVAHPKQMKLDDENLEKELRKLTDCGLGGLEVYNSCQDMEENAIYLKMARKLDLVPTGGSDFHGVGKPSVKLGFAGAGIQMGYEMVEALREKILKRK